MSARSFAARRPEAAHDPLLNGLPDQITALVGHKEALDALPHGAVHLLEGECCPIQMLRYGDRIYATQFHPEADGANFALRIAVYKKQRVFRARARGRIDGGLRRYPHRKLLAGFWPISCIISLGISLRAAHRPNCARSAIGNWRAPWAKIPRHAGIAQLVEQRFCKPKVGVQSPSAGTSPENMHEKSSLRMALVAGPWWVQTCQAIRATRTLPESPF